MKRNNYYKLFILLIFYLFFFAACNGEKDIMKEDISLKEDIRQGDIYTLKLEESEEGVNFFYCSCENSHDLSKHYKENQDHKQDKEAAEPYLITQLPFPTFWGGEAYSIITPQKDLYLIDGGFRGEDFERIKAYIDEHGGKVKGWILTHPHVDHIGAFIDYMDENASNVEKVYYSPFTKEFFEEESDPEIYEIINNPNAILFYEFLQIKEATEVETEYIEMNTGDILMIDNLTLECFASFSPDRHDVNANSLVFTLKYKDFVLGLTGDMTEATLVDIKRGAATDASFYNTDILQIPHHGYMAGIASDILYQETKPEYALLDCTVEEYNNNSVNIQEHVKMVEDLGIRVISRFHSIDGNKIWIYP